MWRARLLLAAGLIAACFAGLGRLPLLDPDEGRYARTAQEMIQRGDYVVPHLDGQPRLAKPVLFYWLECAAFHLLGFTETAARLPSALAALGTLLWVFAFVRPRLGEKAALASCAILATTPLFFAMARTATPDMTLTFLVFGATVSLHAGLVEGARSRRIIVGGLCLGLGLLTKGPVAVILPAIGIAAALLAARPAVALVAGRAAAALGIAVAVAIPWAAILFHRMGWQHVVEIWRRETVDRYAGGLDHPESVLFFLLIAPLIFFPWSTFAPVAFVGGFRRGRRGDGLPPLLLAWAAGGFIFFTLGRGKLPSYLLPLAPAAAILTAMCVTSEAFRDRSARWSVWTLLVIACGLTLPLPAGRDLTEAPALLPAVSLTIGGAALIAAASAFFARGRAVAPILGSMITLALVGGAILIPEEFADVRSTRALVTQAGLHRTEEPVYAHRILRPSLGFYLGRSPNLTKARHILMKEIQDGAPAAVLVEERRHDVVTALLARGFRVAARSAGVLVMRRPATRATSCVDADEHAAFDPA